MKNQLQQFDLFKNLPEDLLQDLSQKLKIVSLEAGQVLFRKGEVGDSVFFVQTGKVKITSEDGDGNEVILNQVGSGAVIGEMALLDQEPRSANVVAINKASLMELNNEDFHATLAKNPELAQEITRSLVRRLRFATTYIERAIDWSQQIAKGDYSFIEAAAMQEGESNIDAKSDQERAARFLGAFFQMVQEIKAREDALKNQLQRLRIEIDENRRKEEVNEIAQSEFFQEIQRKKQKRTGK
ncbi:cyclic nucleotide-binding domain-containing protein [bacterium]|nr:cyclic nucleotide-binding domain-containing protein [bacterium]